VTTLKTLMSLGERSTNIITHQNVSFDAAIAPLHGEWTALGKVLRYCQANETDGCQVDLRRPYMLYLWLETLYAETYVREREGGNKTLAAIASLGYEGYENSTITMRLEFPLMVYAVEFLHAIQTKHPNWTCAEFYVHLVDGDGGALCGPRSKYRDWNNYVTIFKLLNLHYYDVLDVDRLHPEYYTQFTDVHSSISPLVDPGTFTTQLDEVRKAVHGHYSQHDFCKPAPGARDTHLQANDSCSFAQLAYG